VSGLLSAALGYAAAGWPVFPCQPGGKQPASRHGFLDATTDRDQIRWWWERQPAANIGIATGSPGPDVLDIDVRPGGAGWAAYRRLRRAGLLAGVIAVVRTPSLGQHSYLPGSGQRCSGLPACRVDFKAAGGYVIAPPSVAHGRAYQLLRREPGSGEPLDWSAVQALLAPARTPGENPPRRARAGSLAAWVAALEEGNRNRGLFWAACRAVEEGTDPEFLITAAVRAGLPEREARRAVASAWRTR
jgi:hypothetical protein